MKKEISLLLFFLSAFLSLPAQEKNVVHTNLLAATVAVSYWTPAQGTVSRYVEKVVREFDSTDASGFLVLLGITEKGVWAVEGFASDGSDYIVADLVLTDTAGKRTSFALTQSS